MKTKLLTLLSSLALSVAALGHGEIEIGPTGGRILNTPAELLRIYETGEVLDRVGVAGPLETLTSADMHHQFDVNLIGPLALTRRRSRRRRTLLDRRSATPRGRGA